MKNVSGHESPLALETLLATAGRDTQTQNGFVNPPVVRGSTVLYPTVEDLLANRSAFQYGRFDTPTTKSLRAALAELEGPQCAGVGLTSSGLSAIAIALLSLVQSGDHILVVDNVYRATRQFCDHFLKRMGVATTYFDPLIGGRIASLFQSKTKAVVVEAPASLTFEMPDIPAIAAVAHEHGAFVIDDNTWATPLFHRSLEQGVDISVVSATKYIGGHADLMLGTLAANKTTWPMVSTTTRLLGVCVASDDAYCALRGLRTLAIRLAQHQSSAFELARWLSSRPEVARVFHPGLPADPGHAIWKRDFTGATGLFSIELKPVSQAALHAFLNALTLFGMGYSWGGYESLVLPFDRLPERTTSVWAPDGPTVRFHVGLENIEDLKADLDRAFFELKAA